VSRRLHAEVVATQTRGERASRWVAVTLLAFSLGMVAFSSVSLVLPGTEALPFRPSLANFIAYMCVFVSFPAVGTVVAIRRPRNPIGWLLLTIGICFTLGVASTEYVGRALYTGAQLPAVAIVDWAGSWTFLVGVAQIFVWIPLLFPTGHLPGPRWRVFARVAAVATTVGVAANALMPGALPGDGQPVTNPFAAPAAATGVLTILANLAFPAIAGLGLISVASLGVRFRRSRSTERQQIRWLLFAVASLLVTLVIAWFSQVLVAFYVALVAAASIPTATGIAVLRYRLWDLDRIISRTVGWAIVTSVLVAVFVAGVVLLQAILSPFTQENSIAVAASTLVAFALFQPLRRRVQHAVDRRFDRARYDGEQTAQAFSGRLRHEADLAHAAGALLATTRDAVHPTSVGVWLRGDGR
jgi:hypothetical protein